MNRQADSLRFQMFFLLLLCVLLSFGCMNYSEIWDKNTAEEAEEHTRGKCAQ